MTGRLAATAFPVVPGARGLRRPPRPDTPGLVNLKSCELQHPVADDLVRDAMRDLRAGLVRSYPQQRDLLAALAAYHGVDEPALVLTAGSDLAIGLLVDAFAVAAGGLILPEPSFEAWRYYAALRGVPVAAVPQLTGPPHALDCAPLLAAMRSSPPRVVAVTNPASPSGLLLSRHQVVELAEAAEAHGHLLVVDECYGAYTSTTHVDLLGRFRRLVVVRSYSKSFALAGARIAAVFAHEPIAAQLGAFHPAGPVSGPAIGLLRGLLDRADEFARVWRDVAAIRDDFAARVLRTHPAWSALRPGGNFVTLATGSPDAPVRVAEFLRARGFRIRALDGLPGLTGCLRVSMADAATMSLVAATLAEVDDDGLPL
ncbi:aminotransferase class I/II-fold pyridoxal phosphate-dependent enzyme [Lentzea sp. NPDC102401]|uniref:aminotransferase class I/II-fold pyridoxal phosphate-dependent enzyme n=1 Tax=Lentzea sp. NPDC102401 TaxID=3364128 RepID=UPI003804C3B2